MYVCTYVRTYVCMHVCMYVRMYERRSESNERFAIQRYEGRSSQTGTFNFTGIKRDASVAVLNTAVSGKCVLLLIGGAHIAGQSRDR